jgi:hypothetical protein
MRTITTNPSIECRRCGCVCREDTPIYGVTLIHAVDAHLCEGCREAWSLHYVKSDVHKARVGFDHLQEFWRLGIKSGGIDLKLIDEWLAQSDSAVRLDIAEVEFIHEWLDELKTKAAPEVEYPAGCEKESDESATPPFAVGEKVVELDSGELRDILEIDLSARKPGPSVLLRGTEALHPRWFPIDRLARPDHPHQIDEWDDSLWRECQNDGYEYIGKSHLVRSRNFIEGNQSYEYQILMLGCDTRRRSWLTVLSACEKEDDHTGQMVFRIADFHHARRRIQNERE